MDKTVITFPKKVIARDEESVKQSSWTEDWLTINFTDDSIARLRYPRNTSQYVGFDKLLSNGANAYFIFPIAAEDFQKVKVSTGLSIPKPGSGLIEYLPLVRPQLFRYDGKVQSLIQERLGGLEIDKLEITQDTSREVDRIRFETPRGWVEFGYDLGRLIAAECGTSESPTVIGVPGRDTRHKSANLMMRTVKAITQTKKSHKYSFSGYQAR